MGKGKKKGQVEDDWENEMEEIAAEATGDAKTEAKPQPAATVDDLDAEWASDDDKKKKKGKKGKGKKAEEPKDKPEGENNTEDNTQEDGPTVKTKAQKAAEKKQREKEKKAAQAAKKKNQQPKEEANNDNNQDDKQEEEASSNKKKKGKDKGKKAEKEEEPKKKRKGMPTSALKELLEMQRQAEEEEKRKREEQEERERKALEEHNRKIEEERLKKEKKKQKEKEKKERLKAEGKLLTDKEKAAKARAEMMLAAHGIDKSSSGNQKKAKVLTMAQKKKLKEEEQRLKAEKEAEEAAAAEKLAEEAKNLKIEDDNAEDSGSESEDWDNSEEEKKSDDDWDAESEDEEADDSSEAKSEAMPEEPKKKPEVKQKNVPTKIAPAKVVPVAAEDDSSSDSEDEVERKDDFFEIEDVHDRIIARRKFHQKNKADYFRAPVVCVLGHVDTGKTKTLDNLRRTNVQDNEAGGITQQIGATNVPLDCIQQRTEMVKTIAFGGEHDIKIPGLLIIDTPGHESFANLRSRGSSLCDVAILVIDIMHGLENQTRESIKLLKKNNTPFVIALNKIDRLYQWQTNPEMDIKDCIQSQKRSTKDQFDDLYRNVINQMAIEELNIKLIYEFDGSENWKDEDDIWVPVCPTSAHSGDGMGNLMAQVIDLAQTVCRKKITFSYDLKCTIMEVKAIEGLGKAVDAILVNGRLKTNDIIVLGGQNGPICTHVKQIFTPPANKDLRVKNQWVKHATVKGATGVKIVGRDDLEKALAGLPLYVARRDDEVEYFKDLLEREIQVALKSIKLHSEGVYVQASTLGSLEALLEYLRSSKVKYSAINIGPINKRDIMKASTMLEHNEKYGVVLGFDVPVTRDAQELADSFKPPIKIFTADIIYHLTDQFTKHLIDQKKRKQEELKHVAIFPASLSILPNCVFAKRDPIIVGVKVKEGQLKIGSPICVPAKENLCIGTLSSIEVNNSSVESAKKGEEVCIKIENTTGAPRLIGRHFEATDELVTRISREGIDALKEWFRDEMTKEDWNLCVKLKRTFQIL